MKGEAGKAFSMKCINKELSFVTFSQKKAGNSQTVSCIFLYCYFRVHLDCLSTIMISAVKFLKVFMGITF